ATSSSSQFHFVSPRLRVQCRVTLPEREPVAPDRRRSRQRLTRGYSTYPKRGRHEMLLEGRVAIVTGGGRGIGAAICRVLAREGAAVAVNYSASQEKAEQTARQIAEAGGRALAVRADVRDPEAVKAMVEQVAAAFGKIDSLVNNAISGRQAGKLEE